MRSILMAGAAIYLVAGWQSSLLAETAAGSDTASGSTASTTSASEPSTGLAEVVVTASRRRENLQKSALSITALTGESLQAAGVVQAEDLNKTVPGLGLSPNGSGTQVYLRGVGTFSIAAYAESAVAVNIDQVFMSFPALISGNFYDIERAEVLKGPQGTLYGRNATAGAINLITKRPEFNNDGEVSVGTGNYGQFQFTGAVNAPLSDEVAIRGSAQIVRHDGYFTDGLGNDETYSARLQALYKIGDNSSILLAGDYIKLNGNGNPFVAVPFVNPGNPWTGPSTAAGNEYLVAGQTYGSGRGIVVAGAYGRNTPFPLVNNNQVAHSEVEGVRAEINLDVNIGDLTIIPAYRHFTSLNTNEPGFLTRLTADGYQETVEARLASHAGGPLKWLVGAYYLYNSLTSTQDIYQGVSSNLLSPDETATSYAGFGEATYSILDDLRVIGGLRFTKDDKTQTGGSTILTNVIPRGPVLSPIVLPHPSAVSFTFPGSLSFTNTSGKAGLEYDVTAKSMLYATYSSSYRPGGFNTDVQPNTYAPEKLGAYNLGSKNRFFDDRLQVNADLFYWDYKNHQENVLRPLKLGGFAPQTENIGSSTLKGVTADIKYKVTPVDEFTALVEYNDAEFNSYVLNTPTQVAPVPGVQTTCGVKALGNGQSQIDCSGKPFARAPRWNAVLGFDHVFNLPDDSSVTADINAHLATGYYIATDYIAAEYQKAYATVDLSATYAPPDGNWIIEGYVRNVGNTAVMNGGFEHPFILGLVYTTLNAPRTFGVTGRLQF